MEQFVFVQDMPEVKITLTAGPSYFGMLSLAREASRTLISAALQQHPDKLVIQNKNDRDQKCPVLRGPFVYIRLYLAVYTTSCG